MRREAYKGRISQREKRIVFGFSAVLAAGGLFHSIVRTWLDVRFSSFGHIGECEAARRLFWRGIAEQTFGVCCVFYVLGLIALGILLLKRDHIIPAKKVWGFFLLQLLVLAAVTLPFAAANAAFFGDYSMPFFSVAPTLLLLCGIYRGVSIRKRFRQRKL